MTLVYLDFFVNHNKTHGKNPFANKNETRAMLEFRQGLGLGLFGVWAEI